MDFEDINRKLKLKMLCWNGKRVTATFYPEKISKKMTRDQNPRNQIRGKFTVHSKNRQFSSYLFNVKNPHEPLLLTHLLPFP